MPPDSITKGDRTRQAILETAFHQACTAGLEALSIGGLAEAVGLSKSGLFAHFGSKEALQVQVLEHAREDFVHTVVAPALCEGRGRPRVEALFDRWLAWDDEEQRPGGCIFLQASAEYDDRPGAVRDCLLRIQQDWTEALARAASLALTEGHFHPGVDPHQFAFELYGIMMSFHLHSRMLGLDEAGPWARAAFSRLLDASS